MSAAFGGLSKYDQVKGLKLGCEVAVCTPGRMIDLVKVCVGGGGGGGVMGKYGGGQGPHT